MLHSHIVLLCNTSSTMPNCTIRHIIRGVMSMAAADGHEAVHVPHWMQVLRCCAAGISRSPKARSRFTAVRLITSDDVKGYLLALEQASLPGREPTLGPIVRTGTESYATVMVQQRAGATPLCERRHFTPFEHYHRRRDRTMTFIIPVRKSRASTWLRRSQKGRKEPTCTGFASSPALLRE